MGEKSPEISPASASDAVPLVDHHPLTIHHFRLVINMVLSGRGQAVVWSLREPTLATLSRIEAAVGSQIFNEVVFVHGVPGLYQYLKLYFRI